MKTPAKASVSNSFIAGLFILIWDYGVVKLHRFTPNKQFLYHIIVLFRSNYQKVMETPPLMPAIVKRGEVQKIGSLSN
jgi:hypothetical protein